MINFEPKRRLKAIELCTKLVQAQLFINTQSKYDEELFTSFL